MVRSRRSRSLSLRRSVEWQGAVGVNETSSRGDGVVEWREAASVGKTSLGGTPAELRVQAGASAWNGKRFVLDAGDRHGNSGVDGGHPWPPNPLALVSNALAQVGARAGLPIVHFRASYTTVTRHMVQYKARHSKTLSHRTMTFHRESKFHQLLLNPMLPHILAYKCHVRISSCCGLLKKVSKCNHLVHSQILLLL